MGLADRDDYFREFFGADDASLVFSATLNASEIEYAEFEVVEEVPRLDYRGVSTLVEYEWPIRKTPDARIAGTSSHH